MKSIALQSSIEGIDSTLEKLTALDPDIVLVFSSVSNLQDGLVVPKIRQKVPRARLIGCSTSGEIGEGVIGDNSVSLMGLKFEKSRFECAAVALSNPDQSRSAGNKIAQSLLRDDLKGIFVLAPGLNVNGSDLTAGMREVLPNTVSVSGGMAGDGVDFKSTCVVLDDGVSDQQIVAFGLYGDHLTITNGSSGGWKPFGPLRRVTRAEKNILFELDGKPALALYKEYLGEKVEQLPASGLLYPFAIMKENELGQKGLIRTILAVDEEQNSLTLVGNMDTGSVVSLMHATTDELADGARAAAVRALNDDNPSDGSVAICVSCVGRRLLMGEDTEEELDAVREEFDGLPISGFYSYGEISHHEDTNQPELHNQTMTITYISENG